MSNIELIEALDKTYPDTLNGVKTHEDLIIAKARLDVVSFVKMQLEERPKRRSK